MYFLLSIFKLGGLTGYELPNNFNPNPNFKLNPFLKSQCKHKSKNPQLLIDNCLLKIDN